LLVPESHSNSVCDLTAVIFTNNYEKPYIIFHSTHIKNYPDRMQR